MMRFPRKFPWVVLSVLLVLVVIVTLGTIRLVGQLGQATALSKITPTIPPTQALPTPTPIPTLPALHVEGNQIVNKNNQPITLLGASHSSLEFDCPGDNHFQIADFQAMRSWGMNVVRIPVSSEFWANTGNDCPTYHLTVTSAVSAAEAAGIYVMLDLQWDAPLDLPIDVTNGGGQYPMPDTGKDLTFWQDIATLYRADPGVIFDLFGEPHDISWNTWYNGGTLQTQIYKGATIEPGQGTYQAIGMSTLASKVRAIAPDNLIVISGLSWGYDFSGFDQAHRIQVPNIVYDTHPFDYAGKQPGDWTQAFGQLSQQVPVIAAEFGSYNCQTDYISTAIDYFKAHKMSWLAWGWDIAPCSSPSLIKDWNGTPIVPYGAYIQQQMQATSQGGE